MNYLYIHVQRIYNDLTLFLFYINKKFHEKAILLIKKLKEYFCIIFITKIKFITLTNYKYI
jgi:hypothetical protein